jgi:hypothetical protein
MGRNAPFFLVGFWWDFGGILVGFWWDFGGILVGYVSPKHGAT